MSPTVPDFRYANKSVGQSNHRYDSDERENSTADLYETEVDFSPSRSPEVFNPERSYRAYSPDQSIKNKLSRIRKGSDEKNSFNSSDNWDRQTF